MNSTLVRTLLVAIALWIPLAAADGDVAGTWTYKMDTPGGPVEADMTLKVDGGKLTGSLMFANNRKLEITEGTVEGQNLKFTVKRDRESGGSMTYLMAATVDAAKMTGTAKTEMDGQSQSMSWSATRK